MRVLLTLLFLLLQRPLLADPVVEPCHLENIRSELRCGRIDVPLDYDEPDGETISLRFAIIPALKANSRPDPLFFLAGGPGQSAVELAAMIRRGFARVSQDRDLVLLDQRGTGGSHPLQCDDGGLDPYGLVPEEMDASLAAECLDSFDVDLRHFSTLNAVRDLETVRNALGYEQINLYGGSYGTRLGLVYLREQPRSIRTAVFDSVAPPQIPIGTYGRTAAASFHRLMQECAADPACADAFPKLQATFQQLGERLRQQVVSTRIMHPTAGQQTDFRVSHGSLVNALRLMLYSNQMRRMLPLVIDQAGRGNFAPLAGVVAQSLSANEQVYVGLTMNIVCNEDFPRISDDDFARDADNLFGRDSSHRPWQTTCPLWPRYQVPDGFADPVRSDLPVLLLSGARDPVTPPIYADAALETLTRARHLVVANGAHTVAFHSCAGDLIAEFLDSTDPFAVDDSCLDEVPGTRFMLSLNDAG